METASQPVSPRTTDFALSPPAREARIPPLENGDRLTRAEFERRYDAMPNLKKAELIEGIVYLGSPVRTVHGTPHALMGGWLATYYAYTPGLGIVDNTTCRLDDDNEPQPDLALFKPAEIGGQAQIDTEQYLAGGPELTVEIAASSVSYDAHRKKDVHLRFQVREYVLWRVADQAIDWFVLRDNAYVAQTPDETGLVTSTQFPGLVLDIPAMLRHDLATVLTRQQQAMAAPAHAEFVNQIAGASS